MRNAAAWLGRAFAVLGLAVVIAAVLHGPMWPLIGALGGFTCALGLLLAPMVRGWAADRPAATRPSDFSHVLDLLRRSYRARAGWAVGLRSADLEVVGSDAVPAQALRRGSAIAQLASVDGRAHVVREDDGTYVAVGDFPFGAGLLLSQTGAEAELTAAVAEELRRLVAGMRLAEPDGRTERADSVAKQLALIAAGAQTLEGVAKAGVELAQQFAARGAAIVLRGPGEAPGIRVIAVSSTADKRLSGLSVPDGAPASRAIHAAVQVVHQGQDDVFGAELADRRRRDRAGTVYPLLDGHFAIGALVLIGPPIHADGIEAEQIQRLVQELGSRLAAARAVHEAEQRATLDPVTALRNRRELERRLARHRQLEGPPPASLVYLDLDRFKALNDTLGHTAGDSALRHVASLLQAAVRDSDLAARIGGEEFAVWMPHTPLDHAVEVAERIRRTIEATVWRWNGNPYGLAASCGVAGFPESVSDFTNLQSAADAALYRAKEGGRNRVEKAARAG